MTPKHKYVPQTYIRTIYTHQLLNGIEHLSGTIHKPPGDRPPPKIWKFAIASHYNIVHSEYTNINAEMRSMATYTVCTYSAIKQGKINNAETMKTTDFSCFPYVWYKFVVSYVLY